MNLQLSFAQNIIKKYSKLATMAQNEIWISLMLVEKYRKIKIFEKSSSSQIFTVNMTRSHVEPRMLVVKIFTQVLITMNLKLYMQKIKVFYPPPHTLVFYSNFFHMKSREKQ